MKKIFALGWMLVAALALTNCSKEETVTPEVEGQAFELFASTNGTRTTMADLKTSWVEEDDMNVWTANGDSYLDHGTFTISDVENGKFTGTLNTEFDPTTANDWYVIYPYSSYGLMPKNSAEAGTWMYVGHGTPKQNGNNSQAHLSGSSAPLYGVAKAVAGSETPVFQMHHLSTFVRVRVTNNTANPFSVASVYLTSESELPLAGSYYLDITGDEVDYKDSQVKTEVTLTVNNGEEIAVGDQAEFYLPLAPIQFGEADEMLTVDITTTEGATISVEKTIPAGTKFAAGVMNTLKVEATEDNTEYPEAINWPLITDINQLTNGAQVAIVAANYDFACGSQGQYYRSNVAVTKGEQAVITADDATEVFNVITIDGGENGIYYALQSTKSNAGQYLYAPTGSNNNMLTQIVNSNNSYWTIAIDEAGVASIANVANGRTIQYNVTSPRFTTYSSASQAAVSLYLVKEGDNTSVPVFAATAKETALVCDATEATFNVMGNVAWTAEITSGNASFDKEGTTTTLNGNGVANVNLYFTGNTEAQEKQIIVKVTTTEEADTKEYTITYTQAAYAVAKYYTKVTTDQTDWSGTYLLVEEHTTPAKALSAISTTSTKYGVGANVEVENSQIRYTETTAGYEVTIAKVDGGYSMTFNGKLLTWISGNSLNVATAASGATVWDIAWSTSGAYPEIKNTADITRQMLWNIQSPRFACYSGKSVGASYAAVQLYKLSE